MCKSQKGTKKNEKFLIALKYSNIIVQDRQLLHKNQENDNIIHIFPYIKFVKLYLILLYQDVMMEDDC